MSITFVIIISFVSVIFRALLTIIDRYQFGIKKQSIKSISFANNLLPVLILTPIVIYTIDMEYIFKYIFDIKIIVFALLLQISAYIFSNALRNNNVNSVGISTKLSDFLIILFLISIGKSYEISAIILSIGTSRLLKYPTQTVF